MSLSERARQNHEEWFPNHKSTLAVTEPELIEVFENFAFDEVLQYGDLDLHTRLLVILASLIASQTLAEYRVMIGAALNVGVTPIEIKEIVYQAIPYVGMAKVIDFLHATNEEFQKQVLNSLWKANQPLRLNPALKKAIPFKFLSSGTASRRCMSRLLTIRN